MVSLTGLRWFLHGPFGNGDWRKKPVFRRPVPYPSEETKVCLGN
jgi:hypothetical protein